MKRFVPVFVLLALLPALLSTPAPAAAAGPQWVVVNWGDTLGQIAARYNTTTTALMRANNLPSPNLVYVGQRLVVPAGSAPAVGAVSTLHVVQPGETLASIANRYGVPVADIARANSMYNLNLLYSGQRLVVPTQSKPAPPPPAPPPAPPAAISAPNVAKPPTTDRWIDVNIKAQTISAYQGSTAVKTVKVSTGISIFPTPVGQWKIYAKYPAQLMTGGSRAAGTYYYLPNVPSVMYFYKGYAIHGTYWHHNFGRPMSHGCVNLSIADAKWFYNWAAMGTIVRTHY